MSNPSVEVPPSYQHHHHIIPVAHWNQKQDLFGDMAFKVSQLGYFGGMDPVDGSVIGSIVIRKLWVNQNPNKKNIYT